MPGSGSNRAHNYTGWKWNGTNTRLDMVFQGTGIGYINASGIFNTAGDAVTGAYADGVLLTLGTGADVAQVLRASVLNANTALTGVIVGTPVTPAVAADSYIIGNKTADGDLLFVTQSGGNSKAAMWVDTSAGTTKLYAGAGIEVLGLASAAASVTGTLTVTSASASSFAVGRLGATTPALAVDSSAATQAAGILVTGVAANGNVSIAVAQAAGNANLLLDAKGSGTIGIGTVSSGTVTVAPLLAASAGATVTGQVRHGAAADGSTAGTSTAAFKEGTPPVGAATTTSKIYATATVLRKIDAGGNDSAVG